MENDDISSKLLKDCCNNKLITVRFYTSTWVTIRCISCQLASSLSAQTLHYTKCKKARLLLAISNWNKKCLEI